MKTPEQIELYWLEILEALYAIYKKYPEDTFIQEKILLVCWNLGYNLDVGVSGFFEIAEGRPNEKTAHPHYSEVIDTQLIRLSTLRQSVKSTS